jgi:DNA-3-methyladenine glycosylase I
MRKRGFKFAGPIGYAWLQAVGIVNDHHVRCFGVARSGH